MLRLSPEGSTNGTKRKLCKCWHHQPETRVQIPLPPPDGGMAKWYRAGIKFSAGRLLVTKDKLRFQCSNT
jgi:hypothetical protein